MGCPMKGIGKRLKELRKTLGLSQREFGEKIGRTLRAIQNYEAEQRVPDETTLKLIELLFNVNPEWLREGKGKMFEDSRVSRFLIEGLAFEKGKRLSAIRHSLGLSKEEFAQALGVNKYILELYETGKEKIPENLVQKLKDVFNVNPEWLKEGLPPLFLEPEPAQFVRMKTLGLKGATLDYIAEQLAEKVLTEALVERGYTARDSIALYQNLLDLAKEKIKACYQELKAEIGFHLDTLERFIPQGDSPPPAQNDGAPGKE